MVIFHGYVSLPEGNGMDHGMDHGISAEPAALKPWDFMGDLKSKRRVYRVSSLSYPF